MQKTIIATLAPETAPGGRITVEDWAGNLVLVRWAAHGLTPADTFTLRPEVEQGLLTVLLARDEERLDTAP